MKIIALRDRIDRFWLTVGSLLTAWWFVCLFRGETYFPSKRGPGHLYVLADNPAEFWSAMKFQAALTALFLLWSVFHSPSTEARHAEIEQRMEYERRNPIKRSLLWKFAAFVILPLASVVGFFALAVYLGGR